MRRRHGYVRYGLPAQPVDATQALNLYPADVRFMAPTISYTNQPFRLWAQRIELYDDNTHNLLDWIDKVNGTLYSAFDKMFDE
jgi:hypothetical protein